MSHQTVMFCIVSILTVYQMAGPSATREAAGSGRDYRNLCGLNELRNVLARDCGSTVTAHFHTYCHVLYDRFLGGVLISNWIA